MNLRNALRSEDTEQIQVVAWADWNAIMASGIKMAASYTEWRQQEQG